MTNTPELQEVQCGIILLAAGNATRMGAPKQMLLYRGKALLANAVDAAAGSGIGPVVVVLGANAALLANELRDRGVGFVVNEAWQEGMASSIRCGLRHLRAKWPAMAAVVCMVCDQPFVTAELLTELKSAFIHSRKPIVASCYGAELGTPALFANSLFGSLDGLEGDRGARKLINEQPGMVARVDFPLGEIDIDTAGDYQALVEDSGR